tara:strand:- start:146 stop:448 length:303 start_codon:yes stop_codon:yes gene_type:complete
MDKKEKFNLISKACSVLDSPETIKSLFGKDFGIDEKDENGRTPLMYSAMWGSPSVMKFLLKKGADKNLKDNSGLSASELVKHSGFPREEDKKQMLKLLKK